MSTSQLQRLPDVLAARGIARSTLYRDIKRGLWTRPITIGLSTSVWPSEETEVLVAAYQVGLQPEEIRGVVTRLMEERSSSLGGTAVPRNICVQGHGGYAGAVASLDARPSRATCVRYNRVLREPDLGGSL
jgi:prophage regulatory protein